MMLHPRLLRSLVGVAQVALYFAILCPVFWALGFRVHPAAAGAGARRAARLQRHQLGRRRHAGLRPRTLDAATALVGVLGPGRRHDSRLLHLHRPERPRDGQAARVCSTRPARWRAPAWSRRCSAWSFVSSRSGWWKRGIALGFALAGMSALYLSHVRAAFVMTLGMMAAYLVLLADAEPEKAPPRVCHARSRPGRRSACRSRRCSAETRSRSDS